MLKSMFSSSITRLNLLSALYDAMSRCSSGACCSFTVCALELLHSSGCPDPSEAQSFSWKVFSSISWERDVSPSITNTPWVFSTFRSELPPNPPEKTVDFGTDCSLSFFFFFFLFFFPHRCPCALWALILNPKPKHLNTLGRQCSAGGPAETPKVGHKPCFVLSSVLCWRRRPSAFHTNTDNIVFGFGGCPGSLPSRGTGAQKKKKESSTKNWCQNRPFFPGGGFRSERSPKPHLVCLQVALIDHRLVLGLVGLVGRTLCFELLLETVERVCRLAVVQL